MIPFAYAPLLIESFRRELRALGIEPADPRVVELQIQRRGPRQAIARVGRLLTRRPSGVVSRHVMLRTRAAARP